jgi:hypothetical protein
VAQLFIGSVAQIHVGGDSLGTFYQQNTRCKIAYALNIGYAKIGYLDKLATYETNPLSDVT